LEALSPAEGGDGSSDFKAGADDETFPVSGGVDILPDLDSLANAFLPSSGGEGGDVPDVSSPAPERKPLPGRKPQKLDGDFNPKDLAAGIRTVLNKEG
jgi:hypothetical protein